MNKNYEYLASSNKPNINLQNEWESIRLSSTELAKKAYEGYCFASGNKSLIFGDELPPFEKLKPEIQKAWYYAANNVKDYLYSYD